MTLRRLCAVVPAAGRGTRVGVDAPKALVPLAPGVTLWSRIRDRLRAHVDHIVLVLSPSGADVFAADHRPHEPPGSLSVCVQPAPRGMGDAVFCAEAEWRGFEDVLVVWGDQAGISEQTIRRAAQHQRTLVAPALTVPLVETERPYVQYDFDGSGTLTRVREEREGDECDARGLADVGCFALSSTGLAEAWREHLSGPEGGRGRVTGELNFLPFLAFLATEKRWRVHRVPVDDPDERLGINTPEELAFFRERLRKGS
jgi:bifunctional UDP-N-acetylglucosamine pyrophosphorylase/glucosamine-1-phosphate N-acetyltransferase